jgi:hypothetical protein
MRTLLVTLSLLLAPALAAADESRTADATKMKTDDCARARKQNKTCVIDMGKEELTGNSPTAGGSAIGILKFSKAESLIRIRRDFIVEILKTAEDL